MNNEWLATLKVGAEVAVSVRFTPLPAQARITGETPKYWVIGDGTKYRKDNGVSLGGGAWDRSHIFELTTDLREQIERAALAAWLRKRDWMQYPVGVLRAVKAAMAPPSPEKPKRDPEGCGCSSNSRAYGTMHDNGCDHLMADF